MLQGFEPIVGRFLDEAQSRLEAFCDRLKEQANTVGPLFSDVQSFAGAYTPLPIPLFLAFSPTPGGGGYNGEIAWVEVGDSFSGLDIFMHESAHVILRNRFTPGIAHQGYDALAMQVEGARRKDKLGAVLPEACKA